VLPQPDPIFQRSGKKNKRIILLFLELIQVFTRKSFYNFISQLKAFAWYGEANTGKLILVIGGNAGERVDTEPKRVGKQSKTKQNETYKVFKGRRL
jgi:hypothetical protein